MRDPGVSCSAASLTSLANALRGATPGKQDTITAMTRKVRCKRCLASVLDLGRRGFAVVGPAVVGDRRRPARPARVAVVGVAAETFVQLGILAELLAVE